MGLAEQMVGIKAKTFLMSALFDYAKKYSFLSTKWPEVTNEIVTSSMKIFQPDEKRLEDQTQKFLQWLGFSPVDLDWDNERKILNIYIGTSRIWRDDPRTDQVSNVIMKSLISSIGSNFFGGKIPHVDFLLENLPPRTQFGFRITEGFGEQTFDLGKITQNNVVSSSSEETSSNSQTQNATEMKSAGPSASSINKAIKRLVIYLDPIIGSGLNKDDIASDLFDACQKIMEEHYPDEFRLIFKDIGSHNILHNLFQKSSSESKVEDIVKQLADLFSTNVKNKYPTMSANDALTGIGKMNPSSIDELLFYTKEAHNSPQFCKFISKIWLGFINQFMPSSFSSDLPMCKITASGFCLYAFNLQS
jgi:hypothetical protein